MDLLHVGIVALAWFGLIACIVAVCAAAGRADRREATLPAGPLGHAQPRAPLAALSSAALAAARARARVERRVRPDRRMQPDRRVRAVLH